MKKTLIMASVFLTFSIEAHAMQKLVCPTADKVKTAIRSVMAESQGMLSTSLGLKSAQGKWMNVFGTESDNTKLENLSLNIRVHNTGSSCLVYVDNHLRYTISAP